MAVLNVNTDEFNKLISESKVPVVTDFWAAWCGPCLMMAPLLETIAEKYDGKLVVAKVNVDEEPALAMKYNVESIPNLKLFINGKYVDESIGYKPVEDLEYWLSIFLS